MDKSEQTAETLPTATARQPQLVKKRKHGMLIAIVATVVLAGGGGTVWYAYQQHRAEEEKKSDEIPPPSWLDADCQEGQLTDGRVLISMPQGDEWLVPDSLEYLSEDVPVFHFYSNQRTVTVCSAWDSDTTQQNFDEYWNGWQQQMDHPQVRMLEQKELNYGKNLCRYKYMQYSFPDRSKIFWEFALLYYQPTGKVMLVSCWSFIRTAVGPSKVVGDLLRSARFEKEEKV